MSTPFDAPQHGGTAQMRLNSAPTEGGGGGGGGGTNIDTQRLDKAANALVELRSDTEKSTTAAPIVGTIAGWAVEDVQAIVVEHVQQDTTDEAKREAASKYADGWNAVGESSASSVREAIAHSGRQMSEEDLDQLAGSVEQAAKSGHAAGTAWNSSVNGR